MKKTSTLCWKTIILVCETVTSFLETIPYEVKMSCYNVPVSPVLFFFFSRMTPIEDKSKCASNFQDRLDGCCHCCWHSGDTKVLRVVEVLPLFAVWSRTTSSTEPSVSTLFLPVSRPGLGPVSEASLGLQDDAGALVPFFGLEGGVRLLQIVNDSQQPRSDARNPLLRQLSVGRLWPFGQRHRGINGNERRSKSAAAGWNWSTAAYCWTSALSQVRPGAFSCSDQYKNIRDYLYALNIVDGWCILMTTLFIYIYIYY